MDKYLLEILKESNTIIIPGLGAITITNKETGEMMFMPYLQHDDGKLAAFIADKDGVDEADAKNMVAKYVREIQSQLDKGESYTMFELGEFVKADDGDVVFTHWTKLGANEEDHIIAPIIVETVVEATPEPEIEPIIETPIDPEPIIETVVIPEPIIEAPIEPEVIEVTKDEIEIKNAIEEALEVTTEPEEIINEEVTEPTPPIVETIAAAVVSENIVPNEATVHHDDDVTTGAIADESNVDSKEPVEGEEKDAKKEKSKEKAGVGFWVTMILIALLIIAGGAYVGRNYNELKQSIPFLADEKVESSSKSLKEEISDAIKEDKYSNNDIQEDSASIDDEDFMEGTSEGDTENGMESEVPVEPEIVEPKVIETPKKAAPVVIPSPSTPGHYHIIAGAFSSIDNANRLANEFKAKGLPSTVVKNGELNAVSMQSYATSEQAHTDLNKMNAIVPGAWILYK